MNTSVIVFIGAGLGGLLRHVMNTAITGLMGTGFPYGILAINVLGSSLMGLLAGWLAFRGEAPAEVRLFLATGLLGGFTTFSAFSMDTALLIERGETGLAAVYVAASVALSLVGLFAGLWAMRSLLT
ncbi:camphor resistance protein CrcB [Hyphomicrobium nitrativorans NL23]|uniref:Fluoride-specific ion channel FluC n=1 Tax=Hyphomicrobium nitrativorans NL23 TaxID=1029756 RepID=V5SAX2_9HYPH|nr:fluoride efflux transporter CrcB [Hyphomicrobium nitrativorans]AHB47592.1 camphor resistance protein CrcB [Hyphomicrobium nitrativorans NL23]